MKALHTACSCVSMLNFQLPPELCFHSGDLVVEQAQKEGGGRYVNAQLDHTTGSTEITSDIYLKRTSGELGNTHEQEDRF